MTFGKEKEVEIFKALAQKSALTVGREYGFDKVYKKSQAIRNGVNKIYNKVRNNHEEYGVSREVVEMVEKGMLERKHNLVGTNTGKPHSMKDLSDFENPDIKEMMTAIRDKSFALINKKLAFIATSKKKLDNISFKELGVIAGIAFDKTQILKGEATEHIAVAAKIDSNVTPEQAIEIALRNRESTVEKNMNRG
jgi:hypothetical protein